MIDLVLELYVLVFNFETHSSCTGPHRLICFFNVSRKQKELLIPVIKVRTSMSTRATQIRSFLLVNDFDVMFQSSLLTKCPLTNYANHLGNPALIQVNWQSWISLD